LLDHEDRIRRQLRTAITQLDSVNNNNDGGGDFDWLTQQAQQVQVTQQRHQLQQQLNKILRSDEKLEQLRKRKEKVPLINMKHAMRLRSLNIPTL
jgi:molecular chaperone GrpE (heat shock protein)